MACTPGPEDTPAACSDGCSNDGDDYVDCDDRDCCSVVSGCGADTYCGAESAGEDTSAACRNGMDDDGDGATDCGDVSCCGVRTDCPARTGCNPTGTSTCNTGIGEATFESGLTSFTVSTIHDADRVEFEGGGIRFWWPLRNASTYTPTDCSALVSSTARIADCMGVRVLEQTWADEATGECGRIRGRVWGTRPPSGRGFRIDFVAPVRLRASQIDFAP